MKRTKQSKAIVDADPAKKLRRKSARTLQGETRVALLKELKPEPPCDPTDLLDELQSALTSAKMSEVDDMDFPEGTVTPDAETQGLIVDVIAASDEFRPMHEKLKTVVEKHKTKIVLLKDKFGVRKGCAGHRVVVGDIAMMWETFVTHYFGVTPHRLNQLLDVKDEKDGRGIVLPTPDEEKHLFKKGLAAGERKNELAIRSLEEKLAALQATPEAHKLAERLVVLEAFIEGETGKKAKYEEAKPLLAAKEPEPQDVKPTLEDWRKHKYGGGSYKLKYFEEAAFYFSDRYGYAFSSTPFSKALKKVGDPKHADDLATLAALLRGAAEDLRMLADAVEPAAKNPERAGETSATSAFRTESIKEGEAKK